MTGTKETVKVNAGQAHIWKDEQGIIHVEVLPGAYLEKDDIEAHLNATLELNEHQGGILVVGKGAKAKGISGEARQFTKSKAFADNYIACAVITDNILTKVMGSFFLGINKPPLPLKLFVKEEEAIKWLLSFKE